MDEDTDHDLGRYRAVRGRHGRRAGRDSGRIGNSNHAQQFDHRNNSGRAEPLNYAAEPSDDASKPSHYSSETVNDAE